MASLYLGDSASNGIALLGQIYSQVYSGVHGVERMADGSGSSHFGGPESWIFGLSIIRVNVLTTPLAMDAVNEVRRMYRVGGLVQVIVNRLDAGGRLAPHRDGMPDHLRFHLPLLTNAESYWWDEIGGREHMAEKKWYGPVPYCGVMHSAVNEGETARIHLIADFKRR